MKRALLEVMSRGVSARRFTRSLLRILRETELCSIATVTPARRAHISTAYFCFSPDLELYFLSHPLARHCRNLAHNRSMAMTVFRSSQPWGSRGVGLQLFGAGAEASGKHSAQAESAYAKRFPAYARWLAGRDRRSVQLRTHRFYRFLPRRIKILDERQFGDAVWVVASVRRGGGRRLPDQS